MRVMLSSSSKIFMLICNGAWEGMHQISFFIRKIKDIVYNLKNSHYRKTIIIVGYDKFIPDDLQKDILIEEFDLPDEAELFFILNKLIDDNRSNRNIQIDDNPNVLKRLSKAALGLTSAEAENAFALALVNDSSLDENDVEYITNEKKQIIRQSGVL